MLGRLIFLGAIAAAAAVCIPPLYQQNADAFRSVLRVADEQAAARSSKDATAPISEPPDQFLGRKVRIAADARGHHVADFRLNGRTVETLVDTGATYVVINRSTASHIGLKLAPSDFRYEVSTANGTARAASATLESLQIGGIYVEDVQAVVLEDQALGFALVGMSFLNRLARFEVEDGSLLLEQ
ncbi:TIGR02281 family clan AA aspartic protease [Chelativorans sp. AA-79]|uniref:TIGR02281 family clan AA aspartic protease n=1 Tax=Chelativorans sp. AA-79 TaxID=3028735 RepID=UPI0023F6F8BE|nr:TIGR02281 family clan AA aspartic protease [Chelativorans sp. AA-79]WEX09571.1 TIGR02281 family clan AA aspartic protease [Chelativorans sp. AA-79]